jgi:hypothetical protein
MRLSSLSLAVVLVCSSIVPAQHTTSTPPPSPPPPPAVHTAPSAPSAPTHISTPSIPHTASASSSAPSHTSGAPAAHITQPESGRIVPDHKISSDEKIASAPRIGEEPRKEIEKKGKDEEKPEPDLRRRVCIEGECKVAAKEPAPNPDLRRRVCVDGKCACAPGETNSKGVCTSVAVTQQAACEPGSATCVNSASACPTGQVWNGTTCILAANRCTAGQIWDGTSCHADCAVANAQAQNRIVELRSARQNRDEACRQDPSGTACQQADSQYQMAIAEYENLLGGVASECRGQLPDPYSL